MGFLGIFGAPNVERAAARGDIETLLRASKYKKDEAVRREAIAALTEHMDLLITTLESKNIRKLVLARDCLKQIGEPAVVRLADVYEHGDVQRRQDVVHVLGEIGLLSGVPTLELGLRDEEPQVRILAIRSLAKIDPPGVDKVIAGKLRDRDEAVRLRARKELDRLEKRRG
jgi:HEAT repeat protein